MSDPISLVRRMDREAAAKEKREAAKRKRAAAKAARGESPIKRKRRKSKKASAASACKYRVRAKGLKKAKCFKKVKSATSAAKSLVRKGKPSASVAGPVGKRKKKIKVLKVCRKPASGGKVRCETKHKRRRRRSSGGGIVAAGTFESFMPSI